MSDTNKDKSWPPIPGDYTVDNPDLSVAVCTLGKKIPLPPPYAIAGTCKTENIGIERVITNVVSNPAIRFLILAGPEVPGHRTGSTLCCLHENGLDETTHKILEAPGAIPYIENIPLDAVERFRNQVEIVDMMGVSNVEEIGNRVQSLLSQSRKSYPKKPLWIDFEVRDSGAKAMGPTPSVAVLPEFAVSLDPSRSLITHQHIQAMISVHPSEVGIEVQDTDSGTILVGKEFD
ncbi:MAG: tetrahydromethanopterin S-methyltransferase subunit A [Candidatus Thorarchaeota archaeon]